MLELHGWDGHLFSRLHTLRIVVIGRLWWLLRTVVACLQILAVHLFKLDLLDVKLFKVSYVLEKGLVSLYSLLVRG